MKMKKNHPWVGLVPKKELGQFRLIHDLSYPKFTSVTYQNIESVVELVQFYGSKCQMAKCDIQDAFDLKSLIYSFLFLISNLLRRDCHVRPSIKGFLRFESYPLRK
jgi:hypothetical protein